MLYFGLSLVYEEKECDILIQNAGGHFNFVMVKEAINSLITASKKDIMIAQREYQSTLTQKSKNK